MLHAWSSKRILIDLDGVAADWEAGLLQAVLPRTRLHELLLRVSADTSRQWDIAADLDASDRRAIWETICEPGFFSNLPPIPGCREALDEMEEAGWEVVICSAAPSGHPSAASEKIQWVRENLGAERARETVITKRKDLVLGRFLIDDHPDPDAGHIRVWDHIVYDRLYNQRPTHAVARLRQWSDWSSVTDAAVSQ